MKIPTEMLVSNSVYSYKTPGLYHQTQEVQKAMDEKKFEEAVKLRGR